MIYIVLVAMVGILLLQVTNAIPMASVGGPLIIGLVFIIAAIAVGINEAWTTRRGALGWILNIVVTFIGGLVGAQIGGAAMVLMLSLIVPVDGSLARTGGAVMFAALVGGMVSTLAGAWGALWIVNRWR